MPAAQYQIPAPGGSLVMIFTCDGCGFPAAFGVGVNLRAALATGDMTKAGRWGCGLLHGEPVCLVNPDAFVKQAQNIPNLFQEPPPAPDLFGGVS